MNRTDIAAFLAVVEHKTLSAASGALFISQPTLSRKINALEDELGYKLIERRKGGKAVTLTKSGQAFVPIALQWRSLWQKTKALKDSAPQRDFSIEAPDGQTGYAILTAFHVFKLSHPEIRFHIKTGKSQRTYEDLKHKQVDLGIVITPMHSENLTTVPFYKEKMWCLSHIQKNYPNITPTDLLPPDAYVEVPRPLEFELWYRAYFGEADPFIFCDQIGTLERIILLEPDCWSIAPATIAAVLKENPALRITAFDNPPPERIMYYAYQTEDATFLRLIDEFVSICRDCLRSMDGVEVLI